MNKKFIFDWCLVIIIMIIIFMFSADSATSSSTKSSGIVTTIIELTNIQNIDISNLETVIRKIAHFSIYFFLGVLVFNALKNTYNNPFILLILSVSIVFLYSCSDEFHQLFVPGRSAEIRDVLLDTCGGSLSSLLFYFYYKLRG